MPLIRCTNVFYQGRLSRHISSPLREVSPRVLAWGLPTRVRQLRPSSCHHPTAATKCNEQPSQATANPVDGKACSSTKGGLLRYIVNTYSIHTTSSLKYAANTLHQRILPREAIPSHNERFYNEMKLETEIQVKIRVWRFHFCSV